MTTRFNVKEYTPGEPITEPGIYKIPAEDYHADKLCAVPSLSSTIARLMVNQSPLHAWHAHPRLNPEKEEKASTTMDVGSAMHALLLGEGRDIEVLDFADWKKKAAQEARDAAHKEGRIPLLTHVNEKVLKLVAAAHRQVDAFPELAGLFKRSLFEHVVVWQEPGGIWCRAMLDILGNFDDYIVIADFKSTDKVASPLVIGRQVYTMGYDVQAAFYRRGLQRVLGRRCPEINNVIITQERAGPGAMSIVQPDEESLTLADKKIVVALKMWSLCLETGKWPSYPAVIANVAMPPWLERDWEVLETFHSAVAGSSWKYAISNDNSDDDEGDEINPNVLASG